LDKNNNSLAKLVEEGNNMGIRLNDLFQMFKTKGFIDIEIPELLKDIVNIISSSGNSEITTINQELEDLGWGIGIMDNVIHKRITSLLEDNNSTDIEKHIHNMNILEH
jgi:hypothetical protein